MLVSVGILVIGFGTHNHMADDDEDDDGNIPEWERGSSGRCGKAKTGYMASLVYCECCSVPVHTVTVRVCDGTAT